MSVIQHELLAQTVVPSEQFLRAGSVALRSSAGYAIRTYWARHLDHDVLVTVVLNGELGSVQGVAQSVVPHRSKS